MKKNYSTPVLNFNPRSREGSDQVTFLLKNNYIISIHAPAKGATCLNYKLTQRYIYFNPRSREGSDLLLIFFATSPYRFQSTLPRRERLEANKAIREAHKFQSTLPRRERQRKYVRKTRSIRFQSTLPRRERPVSINKT